MLKSNWLGQQREQWLLIQAPRVIKCRFRVARATFSGVRVGDLPWDQKQLVEFVVKTNRVPYRSEEVDKSMSILKSNSRLDELRMALYQQEEQGMGHLTH